MADSFQNINNLTNGINKDLSPINQPDNSYKEALNFVQLSEMGDSFSLTNEKGTVTDCNTIPDGYLICGETVLENSRIVFLNNPSTTKSQIGEILKNGNYVRLVPSNSFTPSVSDGELQLGTIIKVENGIDVISRKLFTGDRIVYWVDNEHPIGYLNIDNPPTEDLLANSRFIPFRQEPVIDSVDLLDAASSVNSGVYQFAFRYVTNEGNILPTSLVSNTIPVGSNASYSGRSVPLNNRSYEGNYPDENSGKQIQVNVSNIDTSFDELQVIVVYYSGLSNTQTVYLWRTFAINNSGTISFNYDGNNNEQELTIEDVTNLGISYTTAKCVEQKDNRLFISNLKDDKEKFPIQKIADKIIVKYKIDEVLSTYQDNYQNVETAYSKKGYMRDEVYSLGLAVLYKDGSRSFAYHIPAYNTTNSPNAIPDTPGVYTGNTTGQLGVYTSSVLYNFNSPSSPPVYTTADGIRHHKMPTLAQEPHFRNTAGTEYIRILSLDFDYQTALTNFVADYPDFLDQVEGFIFIRQSRLTTQENRRIYQQGINVDVMESEYDLDFNDNPTDPISNLYYEKLPLLGYFKYKTDYSFRTVSIPDDNYFKTILCFTYDNYSKDPPGGTDTVNVRDYISASPKMSAFYSPESLLENREVIPVSTKLKPQLVLNSTTGNQNYTFNPFKVDIGLGGPLLGTSQLARGRKSSKLWLLAKFNTYSFTSEVEADIQDSTFVEQNTDLSNVFNNGSGRTYTNTQSEGHYLLKTSRKFSDLTSSAYELDVSNIPTFDPITPDNNENQSFGSINQADIKTYLSNVYSNNTSQYGSLKVADYLIAGYKKEPRTADSALQVYGGDIFISKFAVVNKQEYRVKWFDGVAALTADRNYKNFENPADGCISALSLDLRSLMFFYVESTKNTDLRITNGSVSYYPKVSYDTYLGYNPSLVSDSDFYNTQYSFENRIQVFVTNPNPGLNLIDGYFTRTIYSEEDITGTVGEDSYRTIKVNSFNDLPKNTGEIWDSFVYNNILFLHTPKTLWRTYVNQVAQQTTSVGSVYLGTGGLFTIPAQQLITESGGYGGTVSQWGGSFTPFGYIFPDALQGKIFLLQGEGSLKEISMEGMVRYFNDKLLVFPETSLTYIDNPFDISQGGLISGFDYELKRWLLTKKVETNPFTISYNPYTDKFISFHSYIPSGYIGLDNDLYTYDNEQSTPNITIEKHNRGNYGQFKGTVYPSYIEFVVSKDQAKGLMDQTKVLDNLVIQMQITDPDTGNSIFPIRSTGDTIQVYNDKSNTGIIGLKYSNTFGDNPTRSQTLVKFLNNEFRLSAPLNAMNNSLPQSTNDGNIIDNNLNLNNLYRERMKGKYFIVKLSFSNTDNLKVTINYIKSLFRVNYR